MVQYFIQDRENIECRNDKLAHGYEIFCKIFFESVGIMGAKILQDYLHYVSSAGTFSVLEVCFNVRYFSSEFLQWVLF